MLLMKTGPVSFPKARADPIPAVTVATSRVVFCHGVKATTSASFEVALAVLAAGVGGGDGGAAGGKTSPFKVTIAPRVTSSSKSTVNPLSLSDRESKNLVILFE